MIEWAIRNPGYTFLLALALVIMVGVTVEAVFEAVSRPFTMRGRARLAEANARTAEAKARRAELVATLQPPRRPEPSTAEQMAATPDHPVLRKSPRGGLADVPD